MVSEAQRRGANAIVAMRFDSGSIGQQWSEICAYGTAVWVTPVSEAAQAQYNAWSPPASCPTSRTTRSGSASGASPRRRLRRDPLLTPAASRPLAATSVGCRRCTDDS
jgi:Putative heavy-metal-binding